MNIDCEIIRDLLPSYVDKLTSAKSNAAIEDHIANCSSCHEILSNMKQELEQPIAQSREINYLKRYKQKSRKSTLRTSAILLFICAICFIETFVHLIPLEGATKAELQDYSLYPIMVISLSELRDNADVDDSATTCRVKWEDGNLMQNAVVEIVYPTDTAFGTMPSSEQISAKCSGLFFRQAGSSVNIVDGVIYIHITGYRKTLFYTGKAEAFGFAVKIINDIE